MENQDKKEKISVQETIGKPNRMTVNEYFDEVWKRVVEKKNRS